ncbi:O-acyltransferase like protein-like [Pieris rapae]|uniref:O-acyltransferase like protein-like n=1 Tax=Pieris rapae TaxID=64459 RepID=UPI001E27ADD0|nr:O-acyltransferase like protein-like [Pieris rapae]
MVKWLLLVILTVVEAKLNDQYDVCPEQISNKSNLQKWIPDKTNATTIIEEINSSKSNMVNSRSLKFSHLKSVNDITDDLYYAMPPLFQLDDYHACLVRNGTFCLGSFHLSAPDDNQLYRLLQWVSSNARNRFNHTQLHRGLCLNTSCIVSNTPMSHKQKFQQCVNNITRSQYGLEASLLRLDYCKDAQTPSSVPLDVVDHIFLALCITLLAANVLGTLYDIFRDKTYKGNQLLLSWSVISNYRNFTHIYPNEDTIVSRFNSIHGIKSFILLLIMMAHSAIAIHMSYIYNTKTQETIDGHPALTILTNGSQGVQPFIVLSSFIFVHNFLLLDEQYKKRSPVLIFFVMLLRRIARILPLYIFMVGFTATWSRFIADGTMWTPIMEKEAQLCRVKWWSHALFINNLYRPDDRCLIQTWFIAVDMQLYALSILLAIALTRWTKVVIKIIPLLFFVTILCNFIAAYTFNLKASLYLSNPEYLKILHYGMPSFKWLYAAPWASLPASLLGVATAYLYYEMRNNKIDLHKYKWFKIIYRVSLPGFFGWIYAGYFMPDEPSRLLSAVYAAFDRPITCIIFCMVLLGFIYRIDNIYWRAMSWSGWQLLGRMSLCILMVHWTFCLIQVATQTNVKEVSVLANLGHWLVTVFMTYLTSVPLHLLVEMPVQKFLRAALGV